LSSFAACAQTSGASTTELCFELDEYFGELTDLTTIPPQSISGQSVSQKSEEATFETQDFTTRSDNNVEAEPVGAIRPSDKSAYVESPIWWGDNPATEEMMGPTTPPAQIEAPEPKMDLSAYVHSPVWWDDKLVIEDMLDETGTVEHSGITGKVLPLDEARDLPVVGIEPSHEPATQISEVVGQTAGLPLAF
jgi:hypothetical protein